MEGKRLQKIISDMGVKQVTIAEILGMSAQSVSMLFKVKDVKSGILERIAEGLEKDMSIFYPVGRYVTNNSGQVVNSAHKDIHYNSDKVIEILNEQLKAKDRQIEELIERLGRG